MAKVVAATRIFCFCVGLCTVGILSLTLWNNSKLYQHKLRFKELGFDVHPISKKFSVSLTFARETPKKASRDNFQRFVEVSKNRNTIGHSNSSTIWRQNPTTEKKPRRRRKPSFQAAKKFQDRFPRIIIIGFGKTETKVLFNVLKTRPDLVGSDLERRYFTKNYSQGIDLYLASFPRPPPGGMVVENSPGIIFDINVPNRIKTSARILNLDVRKLKFVVLLEDPIERLKSEYIELGMKRWHRHKQSLKPFRKMVIIRRNEVSQNQPLVKRSYYLPYITRWLESFSTSITCFVDGNNFLKDPFAELKLLENCLGLKAYFWKTDFFYNSGRGVYCFKRSREEVCIDRLHLKSQSELAPSVKGPLKKYFRPMVEEIFQICGRKFLWRNFD